MNIHSKTCCSNARYLNNKWFPKMNGLLWPIFGLLRTSEYNFYQSLYSNLNLFFEHSPTKVSFFSKPKFFFCDLSVSFFSVESLELLFHCFFFCSIQLIRSQIDFLSPFTQKKKKKIMKIQVHNNVVETQVGKWETL